MAVEPVNCRFGCRSTVTLPGVDRLWDRGRLEEPQSHSPYERLPCYYQEFSSPVILGLEIIYWSRLHPVSFSGPARYSDLVEDCAAPRYHTANSGAFPKQSRTPLAHLP
jgi:hypothetical protein